MTKPKTKPARKPKTPKKLKRQGPLEDLIYFKEDDLKDSEHDLKRIYLELTSLGRNATPSALLDVAVDIASFETEIGMMQDFITELQMLRDDLDKLELAKALNSTSLEEDDQ